MNKEVGEYFDLIALIALLLMSITAITVLASEWWDTGISSISDKTIQYVEVDSGDDGYTGKDICAMLCGIDNNTPEPKAIRFYDSSTGVTSNIISFTNVWMQDKGNNIRKIMYNAPINLQSKWNQKVKSITYEESGGVAYYLISF